MSRKCDLNTEKSVRSGNNVSHSNRKTRRRFLPNIQSFSLLSEILGTYVSFNAAPSTIRSIEHNNGIDNYLLKTPSSKLGTKAKVLKKRVIKALEAKKAAA